MIQPILDHAIFEGRDYLIEGVNLRTQTVARYIQDHNQPVRSCFLGYPDQAKALDVEHHIGLLTDWLHRTGPKRVYCYLDISRQLRRKLHNDCVALGIPFVDTGPDFYAGIDAAERILAQGHVSD